MQGHIFQAGSSKVYQQACVTTACSIKRLDLVQQHSY